MPQMENNFHNALLAIEQNHAFVAVIKGDTSVQVILTCERKAVTEVTSSSKLLVTLISLYFTFNIVYPKPLNSLLLFIQCFILCIKDKSPTPSNLRSFISALDKIV